MIALLIYFAGISDGVRVVAGCLAFAAGMGSMFAASEGKPFARQLLFAFIGCSVLAAVYPDSKTLYAMAGITKQETATITATGKIKE